MTTITRKTRCTSCFVEFHAPYGVNICEYCAEHCSDENEVKEYCDHCGVIEIPFGDKYCGECLNTIIDDMAIRYQEGLSVEKGLY